MELYIQSAGIISGAGSNNDADFPAKPAAAGSRLLCKEPDYTGLIPPMQLRRMSKVIRTGIAASKWSMQRAGIEKPDAISIGTAMGCLQDTEVFLAKMVDQEEQMLTPTAFIQSTHNTVSGQIALLCGCNGHNLTFVQRGHSFEHALINAQLYLSGNPGEKVLTGGIDELTDNSYNAFVKGGVYNKDIVAGEGACFFIATDKPQANKSVCIKDILCFTTGDANAARQKIESYVKDNNICKDNTDLIITGRNGDKLVDELYNRIIESTGGVNEVMFKDQCGEYATASAYALCMLLHYTERHTEVKRVVMVNHFKHYYSCWYMEAV